MQIRSILELAIPVWYPNLTSYDRNRIERVQKSALSIIQGRNYKSYNRALKYFQLESLFSRREKLCKKFALKSKKNPKFSTWFKPKVKVVPTRGIPTKFCEVDEYARTMRFKKSPISFLTKLPNKI